MPNETKFTPGPWLVSAAQGGWNCVRSQSHEGPIICGPSGMNNDANWHLIAAAPELYAALDACVDTLRAIHMTYGFGSCKSQSPADQDAIEKEIDKAWKPALAALAKARGEA